MSYIKCSNCNRILPEDSAFCQYCGEKLDDSVLQKSANDADKEKRILEYHKAQKIKNVFRILMISVLIFAILGFSIDEINKSLYVNKERNMATEAMDLSFNNVYADVVSIEPIEYLYRYDATYGVAYGEGELSEVVCKCKTVEGKTIVASISCSSYPNGLTYSKYESSYKTIKYSKNKPVRLKGYISKPETIAADLKITGHQLILNVKKVLVEPND